MYILDLPDGISLMNGSVDNIYGNQDYVFVSDHMPESDEWIRQRLRMCIWKQWKKVKTRYKNLKKLGLNHYQAIKFANTRKGYWRTANSAISNTTLTNQFFTDLGLKSLTHQYIKIH